MWTGASDTMLRSPTDQFRLVFSAGPDLTLDQRASTLRFSR